MTQKRTSHADATPIRVAFVTLDAHLGSAAERALADVRAEIPGLRLSLHAAAEWAENPSALERCKAEIEKADIIIVTMLFVENQIEAILPALQARRDACDAMVCCMSAGDVIKLTKLGKFDMSLPQKGPMALLKRLRGSSKGKAAKPGSSSGAKQMAMLRRLPKILRFIPGTAQDVRAYFLSMQYFLSGSDTNIASMIKLLITRYADGERIHYRGSVEPSDPIEYPEVGLYHPRLREPLTERLDKLPSLTVSPTKGTVGLILIRSYLLSGDTGHYDGVIKTLESRGLKVVPAYASGLDARPAIEKFFMKDGRATVDAVVSLTGFSLVGGPAYNDAKSAEEILGRLDVPYLAAHALEFQTLPQWQASDRGLSPIESTIMVAIPEIDGATSPTVFGGRLGAGETVCNGCERNCRFETSDGSRDMRVCAERAEQLTARVERLIDLRRSERQNRNLAVVLFNFPPNAGGTGTAAFLGVYDSLLNTLRRLKDEGYTVDLPETVDELRTAILDGNSDRFGTDANVFDMIPVDDHVRRERYLTEIEAQWGPAPGRQNSDGRHILMMGAKFGNILVAIQPGFGYEGDPMRLLFEKGFAPTHAFSAFYRYLKEDFNAHAVLHFGTHGALEFMPGKQSGLSGSCWPDRLIGDLPNYYYYAANNPSEGTLAKRRSAATLISYMTPPIAQAGLYRGLLELKASLERWRTTEPENHHERKQLAGLIQEQAAQVDLAESEPTWTSHEAERLIVRLSNEILELEYTLIPHGLHVIGETPSTSERAELLSAIAESTHDLKLPADRLERLAEGAHLSEAIHAAGLKPDATHRHTFEQLAHVNANLMGDHELPALIHALDTGFIRPVSGGDLLRSPDTVPTGRNIHGFDPFRLPSAFAVADGTAQAERLLARHLADGNQLPRTVAMVLWGTDNLKSEGGPIAQALALVGAEPRFDTYGRLSGANLIPLEKLGRPRIDVVVTLSGIFRDLLPLQTRMLAEAFYKAASAEEPENMNFARANALAYQREHGCDLETAALRVFSNADGAYGANVNQMIDSGCWDSEDELADAYTRRKCFAYGRTGNPVAQPELLGEVLKGVDLAYQNLESVELGITTIDHYFDTLGGIGSAIQSATGKPPPVYIGDQTRGEGKVRLLSEQVALETRTRTLNPKWYEGMLKHGYEGVRQIEAQITNTMGWSATTGQVQPWVYQQITQTFVLDKEMRKRLAELNPKASAKVANRLLEAHERQYWNPDDETLEALKAAGEELEDRLEGITGEIAA